MFNINLGFDTVALANSQEKYLELYKNKGKISRDELAGLKRCIWVIMAAKLAPSNLVIRQWALIDLFTGIPDHRNRILKMINILSYKKDENGMRVWAEGYYYYWYTMCILQVWVDNFEKKIDISEIKDLLNKINKGLNATAYYRDGILYGAPYGDVRDVPLTPVVEVVRKPHIKVSIVEMIENGEIQYNIKGRPIGFNLHVPKDDNIVIVVDGKPFGFKFYTGWEDKYLDIWEELRDMLSWKRLKSFFYLL